MIKPHDLNRLRGDVTDQIGNERWSWRGDEDDIRVSDPPPILAIDAAKTTGWCLLGWGPTLIGHVKLQGDTTDYRNLAGILMRAGSLLPVASSAPLVVLEDVFLHAGSPNINTALQLKQRVGEICALAWVHGLPVVRVLPQRWQGPLYKGMKRPKREVGKAMAMQRARSALRLETITEDEADAACLALWARGDL